MIENTNTGIHSRILPICDDPINNPITISTIGVTDALSIVNDDCIKVGTGIENILINNPTKTDISNGFLYKFLKIFLAI